MAKPHICRIVALDAGWTYTKWACVDEKATGYGLTVMQAYRDWMMRRHGWGQAGTPRA